MNMVLLYVLPSISAISIKLLIVWYSRKRITSANPWFWGFLFGLFTLNLFELITFFGQVQSHSKTALLFLSLYYVAAIITSTTFLALSLDLASLLNKWTRAVVFVFMFTGTLVVVVPDLALAGVANISYSITRIAGPYYWVLQMIVCGSLLSSLALLAYTMQVVDDWYEKRRAMALLIGASPTAFSVIAIIILMELGYKLNATVVVSLTINVLLGVLVYTEYEHGLFKFLSLIPSTQENRLTQQAAKAAYEITSGGLGTAVTSFENALIMDALKRCGGNKSSAADMLGISRTTLRRKLASQHSTPETDSE